jgi:hypothetical protein
MTPRPDTLTQTEQSNLQNTLADGRAIRFKELVVAEEGLEPPTRGYDAEVIFGKSMP